MQYESNHKRVGQPDNCLGGYTDIEEEEKYDGLQRHVKNVELRGYFQQNCAKRLSYD